MSQQNFGGGQPPYGSQPGQMGPGQMGPGQMGPGSLGPAGQPPKKKGGCLKVGGIIAGVIVALFAALLIIGLVAGDDETATEPATPEQPAASAAKPSASASKAEKTKPGQKEFRQLKVSECIKVKAKKGSTPDPVGDAEIDHEEVPCDASGAMIYQVGSVTEGQATCPTDDYMEYYQTTAIGPSEAPSQRKYTACLMPLFKADKCYGEDETGGYAEMTCSDSKALFKVAQVVNGSDKNVCEMPENAMSFPQPGKVVCREAPKG